MNVNVVKQALRAFITRHSTKFQQLADNESALLETGALAVATDHYEQHGYTVTAQNLQSNEFRVKVTARGRPRNFSWFEARRGTTRVEVHANLGVLSAYGLDGGVYVVDVGVIEADAIPDPTPKNWKAVTNDKLITFIEAKKLVIYPMLLAQFVGIVHEIKPAFLTGRRPYGFVAKDHFDPALVSVGYLHGISAGIEGAYLTRGIKVKVVPEMDTSVALLRGGGGTSPLIR